MNSRNNKQNRVTVGDFRKIVQEELRNRKKLKTENNVAAATPGFQSPKWVRKTKVKEKI